jgi:hypothetical protein
MNLKKYLDETYPDEEIIIFDGLDEAFVGVGYQFTKPLACYSRKKILKILEKEGMNLEEAIEYFEFNIAGAYLGENTPVIIDEVNKK